MGKVVLLGLLALLACSEPSEFMIQPQLRPYYDSFKKEASQRGVVITDENLIMTIEAGILAKYGGNGVARITADQVYIHIDQAWYDKRGDLIEMTVFHELGHAKLGRKHSAGWSLMNPQVSGGAGWPICAGGAVCKEGIINELFAR